MSENNSLGLANAGVPVSRIMCLAAEHIGISVSVRLDVGFLR